MLTAFRAFLGTWVAKGLFVILVFSFAIWGIGDVVDAFRRGDTSVATVAGEPIELPAAQEALRAEIDQFNRSTGGRIEVTPEIRRLLASQAVDRLVTARAMEAEASRLGLRVPDEALRAAVFEIQAFRRPDGSFDRTQFDIFLRRNQLTEARFLELFRSDLAQRQLAAAIAAGAASPEALTGPIFAAEAERRSALVVAVATEAQPMPEPPEEAELRRYQENNADAFSAPAYRTVAIALLTPEALGADIEIPDAELAAAYAQREAQFVTPERRAAAAITVQSREQAEALAERWRGGAPFAEIDRAALEAGGSGFEVDGPRSDIPVPALAEAIFGAQAESVVGPVQSPLGWHVARVGRIEPGSRRTLEEVSDELREALRRERGGDRMFDVATRMEDRLAAGATVAETAQALGLPLIEATLDSQGRDPAGQRVAMPLTEEGRAALLRIVFATEPGALPRTDEVPGPAFAATTVGSVTPPALRPYEQVADAVRAAWVRDARRRAAETQAAGLLAATREGQALSLAALAIGQEARPVGPVGRQGGPGVPPSLAGPLFALKANEATMVETPQGFLVAQLSGIEAADPAADALAFGRVRDAIAQAIARDLEAQFVAATRARAEPTLNRRMIDMLAQP